MGVKNWSRDDTLLEEITGLDDVKGWVNKNVDEAVVRLDDDVYLAEHFPNLELAKMYIGPRRGRVLFRDTSKQRIDQRIVGHLREFPEGLDSESIRREELDSPQDLWEWAHVFGAEYIGTEKIGNRKESGGNVALFSGSSRRGKGAYVAMASEDGPRGRDYISVGYKSDGYYTVQYPGRHRSHKNAIELENPDVEFRDDGEIVATDGNRTIRIQPTEKGIREEAWKDVL